MTDSIIKPHEPEPFVPRFGKERICRRCLGPLNHPAHRKDRK